MVTQPNAVHQPGVDVCGQEVGHGLDGGVPQAVLVAVGVDVSVSVVTQRQRGLILALVGAENLS